MTADRLAGTSRWRSPSTPQGDGKHSNFVPASPADVRDAE